jgi:flagellar hook protein FlgE
MEISAVALQGLERAQERLAATAQRLARAADPADTVDLAAETVALLESRHAFAVNARVLKTADQMQQSLIDLLA